jgi:hypothetical protein
MEINNLEIAKTIGQPIDASLPVPVEISAICDIETAEFGEDVYYFAAYDNNTDIVYTAGDSGEITSNKKGVTGATSLTFVGLQSDLAYVTINELQDAKDQSGLARKKAAITRSMDKYEVKRLLDVILEIHSQEVELATADDIYSGIMKMAHKVIDYGDNFVLLCGSTVWEAINSYDRDHVQSFYFRLSIKEMCKEYGIEIIKVVGSVALDTTSSSAAVLSATKAILVARDSKLKAGKPCLFVRRKINPEVAAQLGIPADAAERLITTIGGLQVINNHKNILGFGVVGYECNIQAVTNYLAISWCDELTNPA